MAFHPDRFPDDISYGSRGGPTFNTKVVRLPSGAEQRISRWTSPLRSYNARYGLKTHASLYTLMEHYIAREGAAHTFPYKDWNDYCTTATGTTHSPGDAAVTKDDVEIAVGDGSTTDFQLIKKYISGATTRTRNIKLPLSSSLLMALDGVSTTDFTVNTTTGVVTFTTAPGISVSITAGFEFDVHVRYGEEIDLSFDASIESFDAESLPDVPLVEVRDETPTEDEFFYGGAQEQTVGATPYVLDRSIALTWVLDWPSSATLKMPVITGIPDGGPHFVLIGKIPSTGTLTIKNNDESATLGTMTAGNLKFVYKSGSDWYLVQ